MSLVWSTGDRAPPRRYLGSRSISRSRNPATSAPPPSASAGRPRPGRLLPSRWPTRGSRSAAPSVFTATVGRDRRPPLGRSATVNGPSAAMLPPPLPSPLDSRNDLRGPGGSAFRGDRALPRRRGGGGANWPAAGHGVDALPSIGWPTATLPPPAQSACGSSRLDGAAAPRPPPRLPGLVATPSPLPSRAPRRSAATPDGGSPSPAPPAVLPRSDDGSPRSASEERTRGSRRALGDARGGVPPPSRGGPSGLRRPPAPAAASTAVSGRAVDANVGSRPPADAGGSGKFTKRRGPASDSPSGGMPLPPAPAEPDACGGT